MGHYGSFWYRFSVCRWDWGAGLVKFADEQAYSLHLFFLWIRLWPSKTKCEGDILDEWGIDWMYETTSIALAWGDRRKYLRMPWSGEYWKKELMMADGSFQTYEVIGRAGRSQRLWDGSMSVPPKDGEVGVCYYEEKIDGMYREPHPYRYTLDSGEVQSVTATVTADRMTWVWWWPKKLGIYWPRKSRTAIRVEFSESVGEGRGGWKGGTVGAGEPLLKGERPERALERMMATRRFRR